MIRGSDPLIICDPSDFLFLQKYNIHTNSLLTQFKIMFIILDIGHPTFDVG